MKQVEFFFDLGSPYSYIAYHQLQKIARKTRAEIIWKPFLLGGVFKATGNHSPAAVPAKAHYSKIDICRWAQLYEVPYQANPFFPVNTLGLMRAAMGMQQRSPEEFLHFIQIIFTAMFEQPHNLNDQHELKRILESGQISYDVYQELIQNEQVKQALKLNTEEAVRRGVFGAPTFFIGEEMYWGQDRLQFVEQALSSESLA